MVTKLDTITGQELKRKLEGGKPNNEDRSKGFALVNVLGPKEFEREHIPGSINIPVGNEEEYEQRFDKNKEIIVYCASPSCDASERAAKSLMDRGFQHVVDYEMGMSDWKSASA